MESQARIFLHKDTVIQQSNNDWYIFLLFSAFFPPFSDVFTVFFLSLPQQENEARKEELYKDVPYWYHRHLAVTKSKLRDLEKQRNEEATGCDGCLDEGFGNMYD